MDVIISLIGRKLKIASCSGIVYKVLRGTHFLSGRECCVECLERWRKLLKCALLNKQTDIKNDT